MDTNIYLIYDIIFSINFLKIKLPASTQFKTLLSKSIYVTKLSNFI